MSPQIHSRFLVNNQGTTSELLSLESLLELESSASTSDSDSESSSESDSELWGLGCLDFFWARVALPRTELSDVGGRLASFAKTFAALEKPFFWRSWYTPTSSTLSRSDGISGMLFPREKLFGVA